VTKQNRKESIFNLPSLQGGNQHLSGDIHDHKTVVQPFHALSQSTEFHPSLNMSSSSASPVGESRARSCTVLSPLAHPAAQPGHYQRVGLAFGAYGVLWSVGWTLNTIVRLVDSTVGAGGSTNVCGVSFRTQNVSTPTHAMKMMEIPAANHSAMRRASSNFGNVARDCLRRPVAAFCGKCQSGW